MGIAFDGISSNTGWNALLGKGIERSEHLTYAEIINVLILPI
jgi:hypothetical protein